jgi:hypothetical protein
VFEFIESAAFDRLRPDYLDDDDYDALQQYMMQNPEAGAVVPGSGGVRKLRWRIGGAGKRAAGDLLRSLSTKRVLDADALCKGKAGERASPYSKTTEGGVPAWLRN